MSNRLLDSTHAAALSPEHLLIQHLDADGDGTGTHNMNGVYTVGTDDGVFYLAVPANTVYFINDIHVHVEDTALRPDFYTAAAALTNGVLLQVLRGPTVVLNLTGGEPITKTAEWAHILHDIEYHNTGAGNAFMSGHHSFFASQGRALVLDGDKGDIIRAVCQDDLSGLVDHEIIIQGVIATKRSRT